MNLYRIRSIVLPVAAFALCAGAHGASGVKIIKISLANGTGIARPNEPVVVPISDLKKAAPDFDPASFIVTTSDTASMQDDSEAVAFRPLAFQVDDVNGDGTPDELAFEVDLPPHGRRIVTIDYGAPDLINPLRINFPKRAHASFQKKYEGMGWESDRCAWRMYFDERNAFDMYGKKQHVLLLDYFALPHVDYHAESPLGRDTYKIGDALGIGSVGAWVDGKAVKVGDVANRQWKVVSDGPVRAIADLIYTGWNVAGKKVDITSRITVWAGQHWFDHAIMARNAEGVTLVASLPKKPDVAFRSTPAEPGGSTYYMATWGHQALIPGATATEAMPDVNLGLGVVIPGVGPEAVINDSANYLARVPLSSDKAGTVFSHWRVISAWDQEAPDGDSVPGIDPVQTIPAALGTAEAWERYVYDQSIFETSPVRPRIETKQAAEAPGPDDTQKPAHKKTYAEAIDLMRGDIDRTAAQMDAASKADGSLVWFVNRNDQTGEWKKDKGFGWTGSFWTGELWRMYDRTKDAKYAAWAKEWTDGLVGHEMEENHDTGFLNFYSSAFAFDRTKDAKYREAALRAAARLKQLYNPKTSLVAAWTVNGDDSIIDTMMNLNNLWWASKATGDASWREMGRRHALKSAQWLVRDDGSIVQSVHYDPTTGERRFGHTHQGYGDETSWGRGTGWGLNGFAIAARETKDPEILATAEKIASFVLARIPEEGVTWHDYKDPGVYYRIKDTSGAALAACGFLQLSELTKDASKATQYRAAGETIVNGLIDRYLTPVAADDKTPGGVLRHGSGQRPADNGLIFGDYYLLDALLWLDGHGIERK